jgi:hypothetical protein
MQLMRLETVCHVTMGKEAHRWIRLKIGITKRWRRCFMMLLVVLFVMCLLRGQMNISGHYYYAVDTAQFDYITVDEAMETVSLNWRGLQEKDVSSTTVAAYLPYFINVTRPLSANLTDCFLPYLLSFAILTSFLSFISRDSVVGIATGYGLDD